MRCCVVLPFLHSKVHNAMSGKQKTVFANSNVTSIWILIKNVFFILLMFFYQWKIMEIINSIIQSKRRRRRRKFSIANSHLLSDKWRSCVMLPFFLRHPNWQFSSVAAISLVKFNNELVLNWITAVFKHKIKKTTFFWLWDFPRARKTKWFLIELNIF